jgi:hypothetical protein
MSFDIWVKQTGDVHSHLVGVILWITCLLLVSLMRRLDVATIRIGREVPRMC